MFRLCTGDVYTWNMELYTGKGREQIASLGVTDSLVVRLMKPILGKGHTLYTDNFYTSMALAKYLLEKNTYICGTLRANRRNLPKMAMNAQLKKGKLSSKQNKSKVKVYNWKDKKTFECYQPCQSTQINSRICGPSPGIKKFGH